MLLAKSEKAKLLLSQRDASLGAKERQILIMCNGARTYQELTGLFGSDVKPILDRFMGNELLIDASKALVSERGVFSKTGTYYASDFTIQEATNSASYKETDKVAKAAHGAPKTQAVSKPAELKLISDKPVSLNSKSKRSIAASKMYMINLLQMHRDLDSSTLAVNIHTSENEQQLVSCILASLEFIARKGGHDYCKRIANQLSNILPETYLPALEALVEDGFNQASPMLMNEG
jgi:hypothetical protein